MLVLAANCVLYKGLHHEVWERLDSLSCNGAADSISPVCGDTVCPMRIRRGQKHKATDCRLSLFGPALRSQTWRCRHDPPGRFEVQSHIL